MGGTGKRALLNLTKESKPRLLAPYQAYGRMFKDHVGPIINKEWDAYVLTQQDSAEDEAPQIPPVPINVRNATLKRLLHAEPPQIHAEVEVWRKAHLVPKGSNEDKSADECVRFDKAEQYHQ